MDLLEKLKSKGLLQVIGNTPVIKVQSLSELTGCEIYMKCENLNPGGTIKDRPAFNMVAQAIARGDLKPGMTIVEGTAGNTGIGLAMVGQALGFKVIVVMPEGMAPEKHKILKMYGAEVVETAAVPFTDDRHFFKVGKKIGQSSPNYWWANQFDNPDNYLAHYNSTAPELYKQMGGKIDAVVVAAGSAGTLAGVSKYMKEQNPKIKVVVPDPNGSGIASYFKNGTWVSDCGSTMAEGVGICRFQEMFGHVIQDECLTIDDQRLTSLARYVRAKEGLVMGMSSTLNLAGALRTALKYGPGQRIATFICDGGDRAVSKIYNDEYLAGLNLDYSVRTDAQIKEMFSNI